MPLKFFDRTIPFTRVAGNGSFPIVEVTFIKQNGQRRVLPLLFDTGASWITLRPQYRWLFPKSITKQAVGTAGKKKTSQGTLTTGRIEFLGQTIDCQILLLPMSPNPLWAGLFGRECFARLGFGFWEATGELHVTVNP